MKLLIVIFFVSNLTLAKERHVQHKHSAHAHGVGTLGIAFEGYKGTIEFEIPSDSIIGFEHIAKSKKDQKKKDESLAKLEANLSDMIKFESLLNCRFTKQKIEVVAESDSHSEVVALFNVICEKSPLNTKLVFNFQKYFPKISNLNVQVIIDNLQKAVKINKTVTELLLQ